MTSSVVSIANTDQAEWPVCIEHRDGTMEGWLHLPREPAGLVLLVMPREQGEASGGGFPGQCLALHGIAALRLELLDAHEFAGAPHAFVPDCSVLAERLTWALYWTHRHPLLHHLPLGCLGFGVGGAAALKAAGAIAGGLPAVALVDSQPDLNDPRLAQVPSATLLVIGDGSSLDRRINEILYTRLRGEKELVVVPTSGSTSADRAEQVMAAAMRWFRVHLRPRPTLETAA